MTLSKANCSFLWLYLITVSCFAFQCCASDNHTSSLVVDVSDSSGRPIPNTLFGIFFEEINHAGAGGLWAELVSNRGFEDGGAQVPSNIEPWSIVGHESSILVQTELTSCFERNKNIVKGKKYKVVFFVRSTGALDMTISFKKTEDGAILTSRNIKDSASEVSNWKRMETTLVAYASSVNSAIHLTTTRKGVIWLDQVSAMPLDTFKGHGFRSDLVDMLVELKPAFLRFPGGCFVEGQTLKNAFRWKDSVGPWEQRPSHFGDVWGYWTDNGFGFFEGLQLAEDIGARPVWVFNNGISHTDEIDTSLIAPFVQEALEGIEFARGAPTSKWGSIRASMGHPEPFDLKFVGVGNEDCEKKNYRGNYLAFYGAIRHVYPDIRIISNCDASTKPLDHPADMYDYHTYPIDSRKMFSNAHAFDKTPRNGPKAFVSEYALTGSQAKHGTLLAAISEAGFLIGLEKNSDHVVMASYAPLFVHSNDRRWNPDAIVFNSNQAYGTPSYWVQQMFRESNGARLLKSKLQTHHPNSLAASAILWHNPLDKTPFLKIKIANLGNKQVNLKISLNGFASSDLTESSKTTLTSENPLDENSFIDPIKIIPRRSPLRSAGNEMNVILPPVSLTVFDLLK